MILIIGFHHDSGVIQTSPGVTRPAKTRMINLVIQSPPRPGGIRKWLSIAGQLKCVCRADDNVICTSDCLCQHTRNPLPFRSFSSHYPILVTTWHFPLLNEWATAATKPRPGRQKLPKPNWTLSAYSKWTWYSVVRTQGYVNHRFGCYLP